MDKTKMNIYEKLQNVRVDLHKMGIEKTGKNQSMRYFELGDFLPYAMELFANYKLFSNISFKADEATLTVINIENIEEKEVWTSQLKEANIRGGSPVQALGAQQTYIRRYLYINALELTESDVEDASIEIEKKSVQKKAPAKKPYKLPNNYITNVQMTAKECNYTPERAKEVIKERYGKTSSTLLLVDEAKDFVKYMKDNKEAK